MKRLLLTMLMLGPFATGYAQGEDTYLSSQQQPVRLSVGVLYQSYTEDDSRLSEVSVPLAVSVPIGRNFGVSLLASTASATGDDVESLSGVSDAQVGLSYYQKVGESSLVLSVGVNLPSGKRELTQDEFATSILLSQHFFNFIVPGFGQGFGVTPGVVWAVPVAEGVVLGLGAAYQYKGTYRPLDTIMDDYDPGDEIVLTGGLDARAGRATNLSADVSYTRYSGDTLGDDEVFSAGDRVTVTGQVLTHFDRHQLRLVARYRSQGRSSIPAAFGAADQDLRTIPDMGLLRAVYRHRLASAFTLGLLAQARLFNETDIFESKTLFDLGLAPEVALSEQLSLYARFHYTLGDFTGFDAGGGLALTL